jgi:HK97 family phage major capsid protein
MSQDAKTKVDELFSLYENEFKSAAKEAKAEVQKFGVESAEVKSKLDKMQERMDVLEKEANDILKQKSAKVSDKEASDRYTELFVKSTFKSKSERFSADERKEFEELQAKALRTDIAEDGGVFVPMNYEAGILQNVREMSPIMQIARNSTITTGDTLSRTRKTANSVIGGWAANERYTVSESTAPKYGELNIPTHELWAEVWLTQKMLEDSSINIEAEVRADVSDTFDIELGQSFVSGTGINEPEGFLTGLGSGSIVKSGSTTAFDADDLITLSGYLKGKYERNAMWLMNRLTRTYIRKFTAADDNYL